MGLVMTRIGDLSVGDKYTHYKGEVYEITGFSTFSDDGHNDGNTIVHYRNSVGEYTSPYDRFVGKVDVPRFTRVEE